MYALAVGGDFHAMRREHALLVDFAAFPSTSWTCSKGARGRSAASRRSVRRSSGRGARAAKFAVVEANAFKQVEHVGLGVVAGDDHMLKAI